MLLLVAAAVVVAVVAVVVVSCSSGSSSAVVVVIIIIINNYNNNNENNDNIILLLLLTEAIGICVVCRKNLSKGQLYLSTNLVQRKNESVRKRNWKLYEEQNKKFEKILSSKTGNVPE